MIVQLRVKGLILVMLLALGACATPRHGGEPSPHYKVGKPYKVNGRWYRPAADPDYDEIGIASWYGDGFHGRLTANGEIFDQNRITAAHTTLPLPSLVEVENLENGRKIVVRVNDRGPFAHGRVIDLSREAARRLGFERKGLARVRVRYAGRAGLPGARGGLRRPPQRPAAASPVVARAAPPEPGVRPESGPEPATDTPEEDIADILAVLDEAQPLTPGAEKVALAETAETPPVADVPARAPAASPESPTLFAIRIAALWSLDYIETLRGRLGDIGPLRLARVENASGEVFYRVTMGPYADRAEAARRLEAVREAGYADAALVTISS